VENSLEGAASETPLSHFASADEMVSAASRLGCPVHHEAGAGGLEGRGDGAVGIEVVRPCRGRARSGIASCAGRTTARGIPPRWRLPTERANTWSSRTLDRLSRKCGTRTTQPSQKIHCLAATQDQTNQNR